MGPEWVELIKVLGVPFTALVAILWALGKRMWAPGWVVTDLLGTILKQDEKIKDLEARLERRNELAWRLVETNRTAVGALADVASASTARGEP
jgi:hypothetical protein